MKYKQLIEQMTLSEKASLMSGQNFWNTKAIPRLEVPSMMLTDGPHGLRKQSGKADHLGLNKSIPATCFPTAAALANSWDCELLEEIGGLLGREAAAEGVSVLLGPGLNIKRNPLCGRNFEYFSEDPFLSGKLAAAMIRGIQSRGISACPKHFAVNSQELRRMCVDEVVDERALREIYLEGFRLAVSEGKAKCIMTSYNSVNGDFANENMHLLQDILCGEWGFEGLIVTDWGGCNDRLAGLAAGNTLEMPSSSGMTDSEIVAAIQSGKLSEELLDERVDNLLSLVFEVQPALLEPQGFSPCEHHAVARRAARESVVLLKNEDALLPLTPGKSIAVIGDFAATPRYQGAGSSLVNPTQLDCALDELKKSGLEIKGFEPGFRRFGGKGSRLARRALRLAEGADTVLLFLGLEEGREAEGVDRSDMRLSDNQVRLLHSLKMRCGSIVLVLCGGSPVEMPWADCVGAIVHGYLGGQASGGAMTDVLTGSYNPSGKLAESYPVTYEDVSGAEHYPGRENTSEHRESIFVGYRYYDTAKKPVKWPFGHGLSYTSFEYSALEIGEGELSFEIRNSGGVAGAEIAQLYISKPESAVFRPEKELCGFAKVFLQPGESKRVSISLSEHSFEYYNTRESAWVTEPGEYVLQIGASSRDIRLRGSLQRQGAAAASPYDREAIPHYFSGEVSSVPEGEFERLLARPLPEAHRDPLAPLGYGDTVEQGRYKKGFGRFLYRLLSLAQRVCFFFGKPIAGNNISFALNLPYLRLARMSNGILDMAMLDGLMVMVNGQFWRGLSRLLSARKKKRRAERNSKNGS